MKGSLIALSLIIFFTLNGFGQLFAGCENVTVFKKSSKPDMGIVISSGDNETVWNALRLGIVAESRGDSVVVFVLSKAVDVFLKESERPQKDSTKFDIRKASIEFLTGGGDIYTCATCAKMRNTENVEMCTITSIFDLYEIIKRSKKVVNF